MSTLKKHSRKIGKKGQVSMFMIAGIAIVIITVLLVVFFKSDVQIGRKITTTQIEPVKVYVEDCIKEELNEKMPLLKEYGGYFRFFYGYTGEDLNQINHMRTNSEIERALEEDLEESIKNKCDLKVFEKNFELIYDVNNIVAEVDIGDFRVEGTVEFPIIVKKDDFKAEIETFRGEVDSDFGILADAARHFFETSEGGCNDNYMLLPAHARDGVQFNIRCDNVIQFYTREGGLPLRFRLIK